MSPLSFVLAVVVASALVAAMRELARRTGAVAHPNPVISDHVAPVAILGGTAIFIAYLAFRLVAIATTAEALTSWELARLLGVAGFVVLGTLDDLRPLGTTRKLACQLVVCLVAATASGQHDAWSLVAATGFLVVVVNAYNLVDVMDGVLCAIAAPAVVAFAVTPDLVSAHARAQLWLLLACLVGLFVFNRPPATVYAGDAGSLTVGFVLASFWLEAAHEHDPVTAASALFLLVVPTLEVVLLVAARMRRGLSPFSHSPDHFVLRLRDRLGWDRRLILVITAAVATTYAAVPTVVHAAPPLVAAAYAVSLAVAGALAFSMIWRLHPLTPACSRSRTF